MSTETKKSLLPKLRFPEFLNTQEWKFAKVDALVNTVTPPKKLPTSSYRANGKFPIVDQSQSDICGWTDDHEALINDALPVIVFGDHTCVLKLVTQPFAQGADGIKILKSRSIVGTSYLYQYLNYRPVVTEEYKRHYSILKEKQVLFPDIKTGEQQKIAECLSSLDELMVAQARKVDALKTHKKGLMQQLFPREGESQPRLRFPEFQNAGEWVVKKLGEFADVAASGDLDSELFSPIKTNICCYPVYSNAVEQEGLYGYYSLPKYPANCVTITARGTLGVAFLRHANFMGIGRLLVLNFNQGIDSRFMKDCWNHLAKIPQEVTSIPQLTAVTARMTIFPIPSLEEQQRIATCLSSIDTLITAETQKLEALKTHKKGLMQQLFPSPGETLP